VAGQTTDSLRSVIDAQLGGAIDLGWREKLALMFRLGWSHEYASTARPVTATLAGAPLMPFTTYAVAPTHDGAVVASRPTPQWPTRHGSISATRATSPARTARMRSPLACA
jgi:uncharacterized protein with beta-barrel porin domain